METTDTSVEGIAKALLKPETPETPETDDQAETDAEEAAPVEEQPADTDDSEDTVEAEAEADEPDVDDDEESDGVEEPQTFKVKVDGEEKEVTLEDLTRSYSGQEYIQKGMAEAAQRRKEAEAAFEALNVQAQQMEQILMQAREGKLLTPPVAPDPGMIQSDPISYFEQKDAYERSLQAYNDQQAQIAEAQKASQISQEQARKAYLAEQAAKLQQLVPEFADPDKGREVYDRMLAVSEAAYGFTKEELSAVTDARHIQVLNDARKWRELQASKDQITERTAKTARPVLKGKAKAKANPNQIRLQKQREQLRKTGSIEDAAALIFNPE